jgi:plastocyanin
LGRFRAGNSRRTQEPQVKEGIMRALLSRIVTPLIVAGAGAACGGDGGPGPGSGVLTTVEVTPAAATLFTVAPGNTTTLSVVAKDQDGRTMSGVGSPSFSSDNDAIVGVSGDGTITALAAGTAHITASLTAGGVTEVGTATVTVQVAPASAGVVAPAFEFQPAAVDVAAGGAVTWSFGSIHHTVSFTTSGSPESIPVLENGSASRTFPTNGIYGYRCSIHTQMAGLVRVH